MASPGSSNSASGKVLTGLIKRIVESGATTISIGAPADIAAFSASAQP